jgi:hypothetical protein
MGFKKINQFWLVQNGSMTGTSTITSSAQNISNLDNVGLEVTWTGTPNGTFGVLGSVSAAIPNAPAVNFYGLTFNPALGAATGSAGGFLIDLNQFPFPFMKFQYTNSSSTGTLNVYIFQKDLN